MIFFITNEILKPDLKFKYQLFEFYIFTDIQISIQKLIKLLKSYGIVISNSEIKFKSNELNSNFLYYDGNGRISNSISFFDIFSYEIDVSGVLQRLSGPDYCNYGSRTILKQVKKSLPSKIYIFKNSNIEIKDSSSRLNYSNLDLDILMLEKIENEILDFHLKIVRRFKNVYVALSGGLDSRLSLFAVFKIFKIYNLNFKSNLKIFSYGSLKSWDYLISRRIGKQINLPVEIFSDYTKVWPTILEFKSYFNKAGGIGISNWNMVKAEKEFTQAEDVIVLGDLYEIIVGRKLEIGFTKNDFYRLNKRKIKIFKFENNIKQYIEDNRLSGLKSMDEMKNYFVEKIKGELSVSHIIENAIYDTKNDLIEWLELFQKVDLLPKQMYEYFNLICYTCPEYRNQIFTIRTFANSSSISENLKLINLLVSIKPEDRKNNKLFNLLFKNDEIWEKLKVLPQASAPYFPNFFNSILFTQINKILRHLVDILFLKLEIISPRLFKSRWYDWRVAYKSAKSRETRDYFNQEIESYIDSKSKVNGSLPIPNFSFVNFESLMLFLKVK
jgi:hypothetical protein